VRPLAPAPGVERARIERRADEIVAELHNTPIEANGCEDLAIIIDGAGAPWIIPPEHADLALTCLGGRELARAVREAVRPPDRMFVVIVVEGWAQVCTIGLKALAKGGAA
jgi:hypothetical protein